MKYNFKHKTSVENNIKQIACGILKEAENECKNSVGNEAEVIHELRKKCKRIRGLLRIVKYSIGKTYIKENRFYRNLARELSISRDNYAAIETIVKLSKNLNFPLNHEATQETFDYFEKRTDMIKNEKLIEGFEIKISNSLERIDNWELKGDGFNAIKKGLKSTYQQGIKMMTTASLSSSPENFHEWRKHAKYLNYQFELITPIWRNIIESYINETERFSELLGYDHDLSLLNIKINHANFNLDEVIKKQLLVSIQSEHIKNRKEIFILGKKIYHEKPECFIKRIESLWNIWEKN